jgi:hypothetical protein
MTRIWQNRAHRDSRTPGPITLHLRWTERSGTTTAGRWQVTTLEPPISMADWEHPPGLVASGDVGKLPDTGEFDISFTPQAPGVPGRQGHRLSRPAPSGGPEMARIARAIIAPLLSPSRFHVRIVGLDSQGHPSGPPSNPIFVDWTPPATFEGKIPTPEQARKAAEEAAKKAAAAAPARMSLTFQPFRDEASDAHYRYVVTQDFMSWRKGQKIKLEPKSDSWLDDVADALGDVGDFVTDSVNWVSNAWKDIKAFAVDAVADRIPGCDATCRMGLAAGLDAGLAAMGIPPTLPNFDQLAQSGKGYLVQTLAEQASEATGAPVPPEAVEAVVDRMYKAAKENADGSGSGGWLRPDPDFMYRPPIAHVQVVSQSATQLRDLVLIVEFYRLYYIKRVPLPPIAPGAQLSVPVVLNPPAWDAWLSTLTEERRRAGSHVMVSGGDLIHAWRTSHDHDRNILTATLTRTSDPAWRTLAFTSASFVAAAGH